MLSLRIATSRLSDTRMPTLPIHDTADQLVLPQDACWPGCACRVSPRVTGTTTQDTDVDLVDRPASGSRCGTLRVPIGFWSRFA